MLGRLVPVIVLVVGACSPGATVSTTPIGQQNAALGAAVVASANGPGGGPRAIVDGELSTGWAGPDTPYWFEVDLGRLIDVDSVLLMVGSDADAVVQIDAGVHDNPGRRHGEYDHLDGGEWLKTPVGHAARFIRVTVESAGSVGITWTELQVVPG